MPQSRNRRGHPHQPPAAIPASQRVRGRWLWMFLLAVFGVLIAFFGFNGNVTGLVSGALAGGLTGYFAGRKMEQDAKK